MRWNPSDGREPIERCIVSSCNLIEGREAKSVLQGWHYQLLPKGFLLHPTSVFRINRPSKIAQVRGGTLDIIERRLSDHPIHY